MQTTLGDEIYYFLYTPIRWCKDIKYEVRKAYQRITRWFDDSLVWDMRSELPRILSQAFKQLKESHSWYPEKVWEEAWTKILGEIELGFERYNEIGSKWCSATEKETKEARVLLQNSFALMWKYFEDLWD